MTLVEPGLTPLDPALSECLEAFRSNINSVMEAGQFDQEAHAAVSSAMCTLRQELETLTISGSPLLVSGLSGIYRRYAGILPCSLSGTAFGAKVPAEEGSAPGSPGSPPSLEQQVNLLSGEVAQLELERDAVLDMLVAYEEREGQGSEEEPELAGGKLGQGNAMTGTFYISTTPCLEPASAVSTCLDVAPVSLSGHQPTSSGQLAGWHRPAAFLSASLGGVLQLAWILAGIATWPVDGVPGPCLH